MVDHVVLKLCQQLINLVLWQLKFNLHILQISAENPHSIKEQVPFGLLGAMMGVFGEHSAVNV